MRSRRAEPVRLPAAAALSCGALALLCAAPATAAAQVIERNLPPAPVLAPPVIAAAPAADPGGDDTPIGPRLAAIVALAPGDPVRAGAGVDLKAVPRLDSGAARRGGACGGSWAGRSRAG